MIDTSKLRDAVLSCLFQESELSAPKQVPEDAVRVEGLVSDFAFHKERLEYVREEVIGWIKQLPKEFLSKDEGGGDGWSFLNMCVDRDGNQWGEHIDMEALYVLAAGLGLAEFLLPRKMWSVTPVLKLSKEGDRVSMRDLSQPQPAEGEVGPSGTPPRPDHSSRERQSGDTDRK